MSSRDLSLSASFQGFIPLLPQVTFIPPLEHLKRSKLLDFSSHFLLLFVIHNVCEGKGQKGHRKRTYFFFMFGSVDRLGVIVFCFEYTIYLKHRTPISKNKFYVFFLVFSNRFHRRKKTITFHHTTPPNTRRSLGIPRKKMLLLFCSSFSVLRVDLRTRRDKKE